MKQIERIVLKRQKCNKSITVSILSLKKSLKLLKQIHMINGGPTQGARRAVTPSKVLQTNKINK